MAVDKNKVVAEATKLVQKGQFDKAIRAYEKILADDPKDVRVLLKIGELQQKKGDNAAAASTFSRVAEAYGEQGFFLKAVAVYKQMLKLAPDDVRVNERLAGLYQQLGILSDAMAQLQIVAAAAERAGDEPRLLEVLRRMVELEPDNVGSAVKLGELYAKQDKLILALEQLRRAAEQLRRNSRTEEYVKVAERISFLDHEDIALTRELANIYLAKGDTKRALAKLQLSFKADPKDAETLTLLAQAFRDLGQVSKTLSVYKELARLHAERGRAEDARAVWRRILELAPDDGEALKAVGPIAPPAPVPAARPHVSPMPPPTKLGGPEAIPKLLTETDVYIKYGLHDKALDHLKRIFAIDPDHLEAHEKALSLRAARNDVNGMADEVVQIVRLAKAQGLEDRANAAVARLQEVAPQHPQLLELLHGKGEEFAVPPPDEEDVILEPDNEIIVDADHEIIVEPEPLVEGGKEEEKEEAKEAAKGSGALAEEGLALVEEGDDIALAAAGEATDEIVDEEPPFAEELPGTDGAAPPPPQPSVMAPPPPVPAVHSPATAPSVLVPPPPPPQREAPPPSHAAAPLSVPPPVEPLEPVPESDGLELVVEPAGPPVPEPAAEEDLEEELEEVDFFLRQSLFDDAQEAIQNLLAQYPQHQKVRAKRIEVEQAMAGSKLSVTPCAVEAPRSPARPVKRAVPVDVPPSVSSLTPHPTTLPPDMGAGGGEGFDIARELAEELGAGAVPEQEFQFSVEDVFDQFKRGIAETVKPEDSETHYDLGIAYKEMGLTDDAVHEFEVALSGKNHRKEVDCLTMIGLCRMEKGDAAAAALAYHRALRSDYLTPDAARAVHYELANVYRATGDVESALYYLNKVVKVDAAYRDAKALLEQLGGGTGRPPPDLETKRLVVGEAPRVGTPSASPPRGPKKNIGYV